jgi:hypothetical protein
VFGPKPDFGESRKGAKIWGATVRSKGNSSLRSVIHKYRKQFSGNQAQTATLRAAAASGIAAYGRSAAATYSRGSGSATGASHLAAPTEAPPQLLQRIAGFRYLPPSRRGPQPLERLCTQKPIGTIAHINEAGWGCNLLNAPESRTENPRYVGSGADVAK